MVITLKPTQPGGLAGPGLGLQAITDQFTTLPNGFGWSLVLVDFNPPHDPGLIINIPATNLPSLDYNWLSGGETQVQPVLMPKMGNDTQWTLQSTLHDQTGTGVDVGQINVTWDNSANLGQQARLLATITSQGGGLTPIEAQQLQEVHDSTAPLVGLDGITLSPMPAVPPGGTSTANLTTPVFGVIVRITGLPPELIPGTPDGDYWFESLAVVRVYRGSDLWIRAPVHTSSKIVNMEGEGVVAALGKALTNLWLLNLTVQVSFRDGVSGNAFLMLFP